MKIAAIAIAFVASAAFANPPAATTTETKPAAAAPAGKAEKKMETKAAAGHTECKDGKDAHGKACKPAETK